jgi:hypothetical protein
MYKLAPRDIPAAIIAVALVAFWIYMLFEHPGWKKPSGFGPQWQCTDTGRGAPDFCVKKELLAPKPKE